MTKKTNTKKPSKGARSRKVSLRDPLVFVDTCVLLDFYRTRQEAGLKLLRRLDGIHDRLICTYQVEMEFKKNRQRVLLDSLKALKHPDSPTPPAYLAQAATMKAAKKDLEKARKRIGLLKQRLARALANPTTNDPVYKTVQRLFTHQSEWCLTRDKAVRTRMRRLAFKRFILGYPPRKDEDTSIGDALNWEWIVDCGKRTPSDIIIVSRDSDYGATVDKESFPNDWLLQEFRDRVSKKRHLVLAPRLSDALERMSVHVTNEEKNEEDAVVCGGVIPGSGADPVTPLSPEDTIRLVQHHLEMVTRQYQRLKDLVESDDPDHEGPGT